MATTALEGEEETEGEDAEAAAARRQAAAAAAEEADPDEAAPARAARAVDVYKRALRSLRESQPDAKEERVMLLEAWRAHEAETGGDVAEVEKKMPRRVKRKRPLYTEDGAPAGRGVLRLHLPGGTGRGAEPQDSRGGVRVEEAAHGVIVVVYANGRSSQSSLYCFLRQDRELRVVLARLRSSRLVRYQGRHPEKDPAVTDGKAREGNCPRSRGGEFS